MSATKLLTLLVLFALALLAALWLMTVVLKPKSWRYLVTGSCLLVLGILTTWHLLPEHNEHPKPALAAGIGVLPPFLPQHAQEFELGLAARPHGCGGSVEVTIAAAGSASYWLHHRSTARTKVPFELLLPGRYDIARIGLGYGGSDATKEPAQAQIDQALHRDVEFEPPRHVQVLYATPHLLTVVKGHVTGWSVMQEPLIVEASSTQLSSYRSLDSCYVQLPALLGKASVKTLFSVYNCAILTHHYHRSVCTDPPAAGGGPGETDVTPSLTPSRAVSVIPGGEGDEVSSAQSYPSPVIESGNASWKCASPSAKIALQVTSVGTAPAPASATSQSDCDTFATIVGPTWPRDFLLALIGAMIAVGVHLTIQGLVEDEESHPINDLWGWLSARVPWLRALESGLRRHLARLRERLRPRRGTT